MMMFGVRRPGGDPDRTHRFLSQLKVRLLAGAIIAATEEYVPYTASASPMPIATIDTTSCNPARLGVGPLSRARARAPANVRSQHTCGRM